VVQQVLWLRVRLELPGELQAQSQVQRARRLQSLDRPPTQVRMQRPVQMAPRQPVRLRRLG
jgi:hypothetical protein